jgi:hypothetical protein
MAQVVIDSGNLEAIVKDATGEGLAAPAVAKPQPAEADSKAAGAAAAKENEAADDVEGEDGLTPREKRELTDKMLRAVGKRVRQAKEAEEFAAEEFRARRLAEQRAEQLQAELDKVKPVQIVVPTVKAKPERQNYTTDGEYIEAVTNFAVAEALAKKAADDAKEAAERRQAEILSTASDRIAKAIELVPDFVDVTEAADVAVPPAVAGYMQKSPMFAELGYFLAKNQDVVRAMQKMEPDEQLVAIGEIKGKLSPFAPAAKPNGATPSTNGQQAPKPAPSETGEAPSAARRAAPVITPISAQGTGNVEADLTTADVRTHIQAYQAKKGVNLNRRQRH